MIRPERLTIKGQEAFRDAGEIARQRGNPVVNDAHLFAALLAQPEGVVQPLLQKAGLNVTALVQAWRSGQPNFGVNVKPETGDGWQFFWPGTTGEHGNKVPQLVIYTAKEAAAGGFELWASANGIDGAAQDFDGNDRDGIPALVEYALGLSPTASDVLPGLTADGGATVLRFLKGSTDSRLVYTIESSADLDEWTVETPTVDDASEISLTIPTGDGDSRFYRLSVSYLAD